MAERGSFQYAPGGAHRPALARGERRRHRTKVDRIEDPLPEHAQYQDSGCEVSPTCLSCPLPVCRYELPGGLASVQRRPRNSEVVALHGSGVSVERLSEQFGLSRRSIFRILAAARHIGAK
jgi:hypothetical protein